MKSNLYSYVFYCSTSDEAFFNPRSTIVTATFDVCLFASSQPKPFGPSVGEDLALCNGVNHELNGDIIEHQTAV